MNKKERGALANNQTIERVEGMTKSEKQNQKKSWQFWRNKGRNGDDSAEGSRVAATSGQFFGENNVPGNDYSSITSAPSVDTPCGDPKAATDRTPSQEERPADVISYWDLAVKKLGEKKPDIYEAFQEIRKDIPTKEGEMVGAMTDIVKKHKETMEERQWSLPFKVRGREIKIRDQLDRILKAVLVFKDLGSALAVLDPVHVGIPWAAVNIVLQVALSDSEQTEAAMEGLSKISPIICRYVEIETIYLENRSTTCLKQEFEKCLIDLYMHILEYQVAIVYLCKRNIFKRILHTIPKLEDWAAMVQIIMSKDLECQSFTRVFDSKDSKIRDKELHEIMKDQERLMDEVQKVIQGLAKESKRREDKDILDWLCDVDPLVDHKRILEDDKLGSDYEDSGKWLFNLGDFLKWSTGSGEVQAFWLRGPVGSGKSSLVSRVIEWHLERTITNNNEQVAYFYCSKKQGQPEGSEPVLILQSLVRQLAWSPLDSNIANPIKVSWRDGRRSKKDKLSLDECSKILFELFGRCRRSTIILDALDECAKPENTLQILKDICLKNGSTLNLFVSSRNEVKVSQVLENCFVTNLDSSIASRDVEYFIRHEICEKQKYQRLLSGNYPDLEERLVDVLCRRAQGSFQWVRLQLATFFPKYPLKNPDDVEAKLARLDTEVGIPSLAKVYDEIYEMNTGDEAKAKEHAMRAYKFVLCSRRPLKAVELAEAVSIEYDGRSPPYVNREYILQICSNLMIVDGQDVVQFAHLSVREYLQKSPRLSDIYSDLQANTQIAESCLAFMIYFHTEISKIIYFRGESFGKYAVLYWPLHCERAAKNRRKESSLQKLFAKLVLNEEVGVAFSEWIRVLPQVHESNPWDSEIDRLGDAQSSPPSIFFAACAWGFSEVINNTFGKAFANTVKSNSCGLMGIHIASRYGKEAVVRLLLEAKLGVNIKDERGETALHWAALNRHNIVVQLLLEHKADIEVKNKHGNVALHFAARVGSKEVVQLLLEHKAAVDTKNENRETALQLAASCGYEAVVQLLLNHKADFDAKDERGNTALHLAAYFRSKAVVQLLLDHNADFEAKNKYGQTPLHLAASRRSKAVLQLLLDHKVDFEAKTKLGNTALHLAADRGSETLVQLLLDHKAAVDTKNKYRETALHLAASRGYEAVVQLLLNHKADFEAKDERGNTALHYAALEEHEAVVQLLELARKTQPAQST